MADDKIVPPKKPGNGKVTTTPTGPSKKVRDQYVKKVAEVVKKNPPKTEG